MNRVLCIKCEHITVDDIVYPEGELTPNSSNKEGLEYVMNMARYEDRTLHVLMAIFGYSEELGGYYDFDDENMIQNISPINYSDLDYELEDNVILSEIFKWKGIPYPEKVSMLEPLREYINKQYENLTDIYDKDIDILSRTEFPDESESSNSEEVVEDPLVQYDPDIVQGIRSFYTGPKTKENRNIYYANQHIAYIVRFEDRKRKMKKSVVYPKYIICYTKDNKYQGHIYLEGGNELIGIRTSMRNIIRRLVGKSYTTGVSYILFYGARTLLPEISEYDGLTVSNPIGAGLIVAEKFGFVDDYMELTKPVKVHVPDFGFSMLWK